MTGIIGAAGVAPTTHHARNRTPATALFWRLFVLNAVVFVAGAVILLVSPATVSPQVSLAEISVVGLGSALMLAVNAILLRASLRPLDGLTQLMERVDLLRPGQRVSVTGDRDVAQVIRSFNGMLDRLEQERGTASARALAAQEGERQRIARELHDEIGQGLTAVLLGLKRTIDRAPQELRDELHAVQEMTRDCLDEVGHVVRRLRPSVLEDLGLASAIDALAADFADISDVPLTMRVASDLPPLEHDTELVIYRIAQEGLTNIARHAQATSAHLELIGRPDQIILRVIDNGLGWNGAAEGSGIRGMRERAILIGAELDVAASPDGGTEVRLVTRLHHSGDADER